MPGCFSMIRLICRRKGFEVETIQAAVHARRCALIDLPFSGANEFTFVSAVRRITSEGLLMN